MKEFRQFLDTRLSLAQTYSMGDELNMVEWERAEAHGGMLMAARMARTERETAEIIRIWNEYEPKLYACYAAVIIRKQERG